MGLSECLVRSSLSGRACGALTSICEELEDDRSVLLLGILELLDDDVAPGRSGDGHRYTRYPDVEPCSDSLAQLSSCGLITYRATPSIQPGSTLMQWQVTDFGKATVRDYWIWREELAAARAADARLRDQLTLFAPLFP